jgi:peptide/nickel transport system permease protein
MTQQPLTFPADGFRRVDDSASRRTLSFLKRMFRNRTTILGVAILILLIICGLFAEQVAPYSPTRQYYKDAMLAPSSKYLLGTDELGRDQLSRIIFGARVSLVVGVLAALIGAITGVMLGLLAGFRGGFFDSAIMRTMDGLLAFPSLVLAIFLVTFLGPSLMNAMLAVGITFVPQFARVTRANVLSVREKEFVEAARTIGVPTLTTMFKHILLNCLSPIIVQLTLCVGWAILMEASLSFLGLGVQPPTATWGSMISSGRQFVLQAPWLTTYPGLAIFFTVLGINFVGDGLREALDPRLREKLR